MFMVLCLNASTFPNLYVNRRQYRREVFRLLVAIYQELPSPDYLSICQCLMVLDVPDGVAKILEKLPRSDKADDDLLSFQVAFDLVENEHQAFLLSVRDKLLAALSLSLQQEQLQTQDLASSQNWLSRATNRAKLCTTAGLEVIHMSHLQLGRSLMTPYLPQSGAGGSGSPYSEGGALYALGLIHANHVEVIKQFVRDSIWSTNVEVIQHGPCLGLGLAALGTADENIVEDIKNVLYTDSAVVGEVAGIAMGLPMVGTASDKASEMIAYAHETQLKKIIREEEADTLIEQMTRDQVPILRCGGVYALDLANRGISNNKAIRQLLHLGVSDVSNGS
ncbi:hypothetical protein Droror1_Dr00015254 [Drosera rotundifolia]